jgi:hypothetical protein
MKALLLIFVALLYAGTAGAYSVTVTGPASAMPTDVITTDVVLDTEGEAMYGYLMRVYFNPAVLSVVSDTFHPLPISDSSSFYAYPDGWYITDIAFAGTGVVNQSIATLVFHVMDVPATTYADIVPVLTSLAGAGALEVAGITTINPLSIHVPEPTTTMLMGLGLLGILYAGRRR